MSAISAPTKQRWCLIDSTAIGVDKKYEPPLIIAWGVDSNATGTQTITMGRTIIPPKGRNEAIYVCDWTVLDCMGRSTGADYRLDGKGQEEHTGALEGTSSICAGARFTGAPRQDRRERRPRLSLNGNCPNPATPPRRLYVENEWMEEDTRDKIPG